VEIVLLGLAIIGDDAGNNFFLRSVLHCEQGAILSDSWFHNHLFEAF